MEQKYFLDDIHQIINLFNEALELCETTDCTQCEFRTSNIDYGIYCRDMLIANYLFDNSITIKEGKYSKVNIDGKEMYQCSVCGKYNTHKFTYCKFCNASMINSVVNELD